MKQMRIPLFIAWGVAILGIVLGSFFDLNISTAIASKDNTFGLLISAIGPTIGFAAVALMGGGLIAFALKGNFHVALKVLFYVLAACCYGVAIYYPGGEYFGINGFYGVAPQWVGYLIVALPEAGAVVGGYFLFKASPNKNMWIVFCSVIALLLLVLLAGIPTLKDLIHRPRYRLLATTDLAFHNWWEPTKNYKELMEHYNTVSDNFKSFPSGHTAEASILLVAATFYPLADKKLEKIQLPLFIASGCVVLLVAFARILAAAHFLSDVSFGAFLTLTFTIIANEAIIRIKPLHIEEKVPANE